tara:strand:+ start:1048 stop:1251 length:204 start_codon:yes stop_codon:yes gene_type:complete
MIKGEKMPKEKFDKDKTSYHNLHDRIDALEMLSQSILSEIKEIKLMIEERENYKQVFGGHKYNLSEL